MVRLVELGWACGRGLMACAARFVECVEIGWCVLVKDAQMVGYSKSPWCGTGPEATRAGGSRS